MLHLHRAHRADGLIEALRQILATPLADPFASEVIAVPSKGVERWVAQQLSLELGATPGRADGVCANVLFPSPRRVVDQAVAAATRIDPDEDPWQPERAVWTLLEIVDEHLEADWLSTLFAHLERSRGRFGTVRHIAGLFDRYAVHRPQMIQRWALGDDSDVPVDARWQMELWRMLRERLAVPSPPERLEFACDRLQEQPELADLPPRLSLLALTRLPPARLPVLEALAQHRDIHLHLLHPSPALWDRIAEAGPTVTSRREDPTGALAANPLLASWGRDARELQVVLHRFHDARHDHHHDVAHATGTLLARLQQDVRDDAAPPLDPQDRPVLGLQDESVVVHSCHGRARQVEILRDAVLHLLADDPTLEPRDVIVMCPDIEVYAPLIHAAFGSGEVLEDLEEDEDAGDPAATTPVAATPDLRVRLADRSLRQTNPVLGVVARVLELADARITASEVLDLADREPVRRRFRFDDEDLARIEDWVASSGIRWGLDAGHRRPFSLAYLQHGTWRTGLDRVSLGVTMTEDDRRLVDGVLPLDDVGSSDIDLAGRLEQLVSRLQSIVATFGARRPLGAWAQVLADAADALAHTSPRDAWQRQELARLLADVTDEGAQAGPDLGLDDVRALLADRLRGRPTRANFRTGHLTVCTLVPMRAVPHRVVCLLGLDDEVFPRAGHRDGDDLVLDDPHVGDRDGRQEDRQLLLDALMSATERLVITYSGRDERTNARRAPAVPIGELLDVVDRTVRTGDGTPARERVVVEHPLQPFDPRNFADGGVRRHGPWGFDPTVLAGARALTQPRERPGRFLPGPLPPLGDPVVEVRDLVRFVERPIRTFLRTRLGITVGQYDDEVQDALSVEAGGLERWEVGRRLLEARLRNVGADAAIRAELARGTLPPGRLGDAVIDGVRGDVEAVVACAAELLDLTTEPSSVDVRATLADGRTLSGTVSGVVGDVLRLVTFSRLGPQHRLASWVQLLAMSAAHPDRAFTAVAIGRARADQWRASVSCARLGPFGAEEAAEQLAVLVDLFDRGMREPLPLACKTSAAYAAAAAARGNPIGAATKEWESGFNWPKEDAEPEHEMVFRRRLPPGLLFVAPARDDEHGPGWADAEQSRFGRYARRLWDPLLAAERLEDR